MADINKRTLGQTDIEITPIGLGVMQFAGGTGTFRVMYQSVSDADMNAIIQTALDGGINWFDTAEMYGKGRSEEGLARGLQAAGRSDDDVVIATKWWPLLRTAGSIAKTISDRIHFLSPYSIALHQVHWSFGFSSVEKEMEAMADLVDAGMIRSVGISNHSAEQMRRAHDALAKRDLPLASNQMHYSLLSRDIETNGVLDTAKELGVTIISYSPLDSGLLSGKFHKDPELLGKVPFGRRMRFRSAVEKSRPLIDVLDGIAQAHDVTIAQVALNWLVNFHGETVVAIPGASKPQHARESAGAMAFSLTEAEMAQIDEASREIK